VVDGPQTRKKGGKNSEDAGRIKVFGEWPLNVAREKEDPWGGGSRTIASIASIPNTWRHRAGPGGGGRRRVGSAMSRENGKRSKKKREEIERFMLWEKKP